MFALTPAWHGLGTVLDHVPNSAEAMQAAGLDWRVSKVPLLTDEGTAVEEHFATVRRDTGKVLGVVGKGYRIVQNREAFDFLDSLLQDGVMRYESAGALRDGRVVWVLARMPSMDEIAPGDNSMRYVLFSTAHDGTGSVQAIPTSVRVVCANTLRVATASSVGIRHSGDVRQKLDVARRYLSQFDEKFTLFRDRARVLAERKFAEADARQYIETLFPEVKEPGRAQNTRERKVEAVRRNYRNERQQLTAIRGTWWALLNAVTEGVDHDDRRNVSTRKGQENRMASALTGSGADFKAEAFRLAVQMAG